MKDFIKVFLLLIAGFAFFFGLTLLGTVNPFVIALLRIIIGAGIIIAGILILRKSKKWSHRLPKEKEKEYDEWYKNQFRKE